MAETVGDVTLPSYLETSRGPRGGAGESLCDLTLRIGEVVGAYSPHDPENRGPTAGKQWAYVVNVIYRDGVGMRSIVPYRCTVADLFGSLGDHFRHTVRRTDAQKPTGNFTKGAQVLVLCPNGDKGNAIIIGGVRHTQDATSDPNKTFLDFEFNGVHVSIDDQGALTLEVPGPTKIDGTPDNRDSNNHGSTLSFSKDGTITVTDKNGESITISPANKAITVNAGSQTSTIEKKWTLKVPMVDIEADEVVVKSSKIGLGDSQGNINRLDEVVVGSGIDTLTGLPYFILGNTSGVVKVKKTDSLLGI